LATGAKHNLTTVIVSSERCKRHFVWTQSATAVRVSQPGVKALQRIVRVHDSASGANRGRVVSSEIEFLRTVPLPSQHASVNIPNYFKASSGRVRLGVS